MRKTMPIAVAAILFSVIAAVLIAKLLFVPEDNGMNLEEKAAEAEDFEKAAEIRDKLREMEK